MTTDHPTPSPARVSLVTGSTRGLGRAVATALAASGDHVVVTGRTRDDVDRAVADLVTRGGAASGIVLDVDSPASVRCAAEEVREQHGHLDVLVNNAGILPEATGPAAELADGPTLEQTFRTNLFGPAAVTEAFLPLLRRSPAGRIVNVSSKMGSISDQADPTSPWYDTAVPAYRASKAALNSLTVSLAKLLDGTGVVVTAVCPGFVRTDLTPANHEQAPLDADEAAEVVVRAASAPVGSVSGTFVDASGPVAW